MTDKEIPSGEAAIVQKQAAEALEESEGKFKLFIDHAIEALYLHEMSGAIVDVNETAVKDSGYSRDELLHLTAFDIDPTLRDYENRAAIWEQLPPFEYQTYHTYHRHKSGTLYPIEVRVGKILLNGKPFMLSLAQNVADRKQAEDTLRESEIKYRTVIEMTGTGYLILDSQGMVLDANQEYVRLSGHTKLHDILGRNVIAWTAEGAKQRNAEAVAQCVKNGFIRNFVTKYVDGSGKITPVEINASVDGEGESLRIISLCRDITERKQAEGALRESEEKFRSVFNTLIDLYYQTDMQGLITNLSPSCFNLSGWKPEELIGHNVLELYPDPEQRTALLEKLHRDGAVSDYEITLLHRDGRCLSVSISSHLTRDEQGNPKYVEGTIRDITERKRVEEELRESEERFSVAFKTSPYAITITRAADGLFVEVNDAFYAMTGFTREETASGASIGMGLWVDGEDRNRVVKELLGGGTVVAQEFKFKKKDGEIMKGLFSAHLIRIKNDAYVLSSIDDITDRRRAEEETRRERAYFDRLVETAPEGVAITDTQGNVMRVNAEFVRMFGYEADEAVGRCIDDLVAPPALREEARAITTSTGQGEKVISETVRCRKDGTLVDVSLIVAPILIAGKQEAVYAIYRDITERKRAEAQLRQSQKMEAIGQLAGGVAHDFNNLLTGILGNIALMRTNLPPGDPLLENLTAVEISARQAADLTKGLLTFSHSAMVLPVPMNITAALDTTLTLLKQSLPATMDIVRDEEQPAWNVLLDQSQMTQILFNLAVNARDAMRDKGTLTITVRNEIVEEEYLQAHPFARAGEFVHLSVTDTGPGMSSEVIQHLFEPFYTTKPIGSGTGLGLSVVYGAVKQAGGWIIAVSAKGSGKTAPRIEQTSSGATFDIYLPRCLDKPGQSCAPASIPVHAGGSTVLVVEDEPVVCAVAQTLLSRGGYAVLTAGDGASALSVLRDHPDSIGLILLDMTMPGMTTGEIVRAIRALDPTVPILLNSGYSSNAAIEHMLDEGTVQGFLGKPYDPNQLVENVQKLICRG